MKKENEERTIMEESERTSQNGSGNIGKFGTLEEVSMR